MSILDDFQDYGIQGRPESVSPGRDEYGYGDLGQDVRNRGTPGLPGRAEGRGLFSLGMGTHERKVTRGRGQTTAVAAARDIVVVATARNYILRYNYSMENLDSGSSFETEADILKPLPETTITAIYLDPSTHHLLVSLQHHAGQDTHYLHSSWTKTRLLTKMKGAQISAVGWNRAAPPMRAPGTEGRDFRLVEETGAELSTREVLVAAGGSLYSLVVEPRDKREKTFKKVFTFKESTTVICGVEQQTLRDGRILVLMITNEALFVVTGGPSLEAIFAVYSTGKVLEPFANLPVPSAGSHLHLGYGADGWPHRFAWLVDDGVYHGALNVDHAKPQDSDSAYVEHWNFWRLDKAKDRTRGARAISMVPTEYHFLLLFQDFLLVVNRINQKVIQCTQFQTKGSRVTGQPLGLASDRITGLVYLFTSEALLDVGSDGEDKDIWKVYLDMRDYADALRVCRTAAQRDEVYSKQAEVAMSQNDNVSAARTFAKLQGSSPTFEDIALKFIELEDTEALQEFLMAKLQALGHDDRAQKTMVASWLTELYLDKINKALLEESGEQGPQYDKCVADLRNFLSTHVEVLDVNTTVTLLSSYGRMDDLMHFAECRRDHETLLECLMQRGDVLRALGVMRLPSVPRELVYKFAPHLMGLAPGLAVELWMQQQPPLDPKRLLPAMVSLGEYGSSAEARKQAIRYLEYSMNRLGSQDSAIHNLAIALYTLEDDEQPLVTFLENSARNAIGKLYFDAKYALRLVRERNCERACVVMLCVLGLFEDAVETALSMDLQLAKSVARYRELYDEGLQRKLWLAIAKHVIQSEDPGVDQQEHISQAVGLLDDADGLLKIEDILPFFPDFVTIDKFQGPIRKSLEDYNKQIDTLKNQMDEATDIADALRRDLKGLESRTAVVDMERPCARCDAGLGDTPRSVSLPSGGALQPYFVFPTGLAFHGVCLCAEVLELVGPRKQERVQKLMTRLSKVAEGADKAPPMDGDPEASVLSLQRELEEEIASECPRNGEIVIRMIGKPFVDAQKDKEELESWSIRVNV
ncbi:unnamed protein product [Ostreobium quekettii]|uniref:Pep3/Vps18 beta-propeller domain-containing protein n=1 Tax=Ostreobium quekettii TaxID=121088 RepID=A0A8S1IWA7_9CHLO|nr:unnamed protein product [Ostreobium quekettii]